MHTTVKLFNIYFRLILFLLFLLTIGCENHSFNNKESLKPISKGKNYNQVKSLTDLLEVETAFPLEQNDLFFSDDPKLAMLTESGIFLSDERGNNLFRFHLDGSFDRRIAAAGEGPRDVHRLHFGTRIFDDLLAFWELQRAHLVVFSAQGEFKFRVDLRNPIKVPGKQVPIGTAFAWPTKDRLILAGVFDGTEQKIGTALYQVSWTSDGEIERIQFDTMLCYRERHPEQKYGDGTADHLVQVGETFWLGSPDFSRLTFLSPTEPSKVVYDIQVPDPLTPALYDQVDWSNRRNRFELFNKNGMVHDIQTFSNLILVKVGALGYVPFDPDGTQLAEHRIRANMSTLKDVYEETGLFITNRKYVLFLEEHIGRTIRIPSDYDREDEEQPFVVLTRLKPDFR